MLLPPTQLTAPRSSPSSVMPTTDQCLQKATKRRNAFWTHHPLIPSWVSLKKVELERYFTRPEVAQKCWDSLLKIMTQDYAPLSHYTFLEPSAGKGVFYDLLPKNKRLGIDIVPSRPEFETTDFLSWSPPADRGPLAVIGNPPFGYRAWLALAFLHHSATFANYIGFILPMAFQSDGKGSPKHRVVGAELIEMQLLPKNAFITASGSPVPINALWQVWKRGVNHRKPSPSCCEWIDLFTVDMRKERLCGQERLPEAHWFLQRTFYNDPPTLVKDFSDVRYVCGYGIVIKKEPEAITKCLKEADWQHYSNLAAHHCHHISMYHIRKVLTDKGFVDRLCST